MRPLCPFTPGCATAAPVALIGSESSGGGSGEVALWRAVIEQAMNDACTKPRVMPCGDRTFSSLESEKARDWFWRAGVDFGFVCDCADLNGSAVAGYAKDVIDGGGRRRRARRGG